MTRGVASAGLLYAYPFVAATSGGTHVIEPIAQIITRQKSVDQRRLPDEDAKSLVFDDTNLFDIDKFSGYDRVETGTRANVGLQYTFQSNSGWSTRAAARPELSICPATTPIAIRASIPTTSSTSRRRAASRPPGPTT